MLTRNRGLNLFLAPIALIAILCAAAPLAAQDASRPWMNPKLSPEVRADMVLKQLTLDEKISLLHGNGMPDSGAHWAMPLTHLANGGAGYVEGIPRLGIPPIIMSDAAYGVRASGINGRYSTALPSDLGAASSWDTQSACAYGTIIGQELHAIGFDMTLGGGVDLVREPRNGRTFEYAGEDPLLAGTMDGNMMKCEQAQHVIGDIKHYVMNDQEAGRNFVNAIISKKAMQESDLLAFHIAISIAHPGAVMCSYNRINGDYACQNPYTLNDVLKGQWGFKGFVLSDWGGTHSTVAASAAGLDQEQPMDEYYGPKLKQAVEDGKVPLSQIDDHARRVLYAEFASGVVDDPPQKSVVDAMKGFEVAQRVEEESIVLLKNSRHVLPIDPSRVHRIAIIGGHADVGMISGGGSAQVDPPGGNAIMPPGQGATRWDEQIWFPTSPLKALRAKLPNSRIEFNPGTDPQSAAELARNSDLAIVFAYQWESEGMDVPSLALSGNQNDLIEQVAAANPHTIVVLESGTAVTMPWIGKVAGVVEAWYAGSSGQRALANVLVGEVDPSGKLPLTFPRGEEQLPHPVIPTPPAFHPHHGSDMAVQIPNYSMDYTEGAEVGYKWFEAHHEQPLFPFGFGLSYTTYAYSGLSVDSSAKTVSFTVRNTGQRAGTEIAEVYAQLPPDGEESAYRRLAGWKRLQLAPGESRTVTVSIDPRVLEVFNTAQESWSLPAGAYKVFVGPSSANTPLTATLQIP